MSDAHVLNVLQRDFCATAPNQKWATDVTEFNVNGHKLYLSACMDLYNGEIVAYRMARRPAWTTRAIESFFGPLKAEYFHLEKPDSMDVLEAGVHDYVYYYNHERIKLGLQGLSPVQYRLRSTA